MTVDTMALFFGFLTAAANLLTLGLLTSRWTGRLGSELRALVQPFALPLAALIAVVAGLGSLWMSMGGNLAPCRLCWFQRTMMYPLAVILPIAALRRDPGIRWYGTAVAALGLTVSAYHYTIEWFPDLEKGSCDIAVPCTLVWFREFGFMSLAYMAGSAFLAVLVLLQFSTAGRRTEPVAQPDDAPLDRRSAPVH